MNPVSFIKCPGAGTIGFKNAWFQVCSIKCAVSVGLSHWCADRVQVVMERNTNFIGMNWGTRMERPKPLSRSTSSSSSPEMKGSLSPHGKLLVFCGTGSIMGDRMNRKVTWNGKIGKLGVAAKCPIQEKSSLYLTTLEVPILEQAGTKVFPCGVCLFVFCLFCQTAGVPVFISIRLSCWSHHLLEVSTISYSLKLYPACKSCVYTVKSYKPPACSMPKPTPGKVRGLLSP